MDIRSELLAGVKAFAHKEGISLNTFGHRYFNDGRFATRLADPKKGMSLRNIQRLLDLITPEDQNRTHANTDTAREDRTQAAE